MQVERTSYTGGVFEGHCREKEAVDVGVVTVCFVQVSLRPRGQGQGGMSGTGHPSNTLSMTSLERRAFCTVGDDPLPSGAQASDHIVSCVAKHTGETVKVVQ